MATAFILDFPGAGAADYDFLLQRLALGGRLPPGALIHAAGPGEIGWRVCDVWESPAAFQPFAETQIGVLIAERGLTAPFIRSFPVEQTREGVRGPVGFMHVALLPGLDAERFAAFDAAVFGTERAAPEGCVRWVAGALGDGWCVLDYWSSREVRDAFVQSRVRPVMQTAALAGPPGFEAIDVHHSLTEPAAVA